MFCAGVRYGGGDSANLGVVLSKDVTAVTEWLYRYPSNSSDSKGHEPMSEKKNRQDSTVGRNNPGRDAIGAAMRFITSITGSDFAQKYDLQPTIDRVIYQST